MIKKTSEDQTFEQLDEIFQIVETYVNGNISDARAAIGGDIKKYQEAVDLFETLGSPEDVAIFKKRMTA